MMRLLVIRTSAMGDVAFTTPVLAGVLQQYPGTEIVLITRPAFRHFFEETERLKLYLPDLNGRHKGLWGILLLFSDLRKTGSFDYVIDLHDVLRSKLLRVLFRMSGVPAAVIDKGRKEKRILTAGSVKKKLKHSVERYCDAFEKAGFKTSAAKGPWIRASEDALHKADLTVKGNGILNIGVAPYAKHELKVWPEEYMVELLNKISSSADVKYWFFGGNEDALKLEALTGKVRNSFCLAGKMSLDEELAIMSRLDLMIAMDSSNMHMAALTGAKVISIWGATDPLMGFSAWNQPDDFSIRIPVEELTCRPCTVFGKGKCRRGDFACMRWLTPEKVYNRLKELKILT